MQRVIVTGANGFVGNHLQHELDASGIETIGVGYSGSNNTDKLVLLDLTNPEDCAKLDFSSVSGVIHLAGLAAVGDSFTSPMKYIQTNMGIEINLFEAALKQNVKPRFLVISSGSLYDAAAKLPLKETSETIPSSPYAISKLGQEQIAQYYSRLGFECIIARPFNHIGPGQGPGFIVPDLATQIKEAKENNSREIKVGNLDTKRDYTDVRDISKAYRLLLEKGRPGEIYNVCSGKAISGHDILKGLAKAAGIEVDPIVDPQKNRPVDNPIIYGDYAKLKRDTGWQPEIGLEQTLADVMSSM